MAARVRTALLRSAASKIARASPPSRAFSRYARPGGYVQPQHPPALVPPADSGNPSRYARSGGYAPPPVSPTETGSSHVSRYARSAGSTSTPPPPPPPPPQPQPVLSPPMTPAPSSKNLPTNDSKVAASGLLKGAKAEPIPESSTTDAAACFLIVGGLIFFTWTKRKEESVDAAANATGK